MATAPPAKELSLSDIPLLDKQIATLMECKPLAENDVKALCEKVSRSCTNNLGKRDYHIRIQREAGERSGHYLRRRPRTVPRLERTLQNRYVYIF